MYDSIGMKCADRKIQREGKLISDCQRLMVIRNEEWLIIGTKFLFQAITLFWKLDIDDSCTTMYLGWRLMNYVLQKFYAICIIYSFLQKKILFCLAWVKYSLLWNERGFNIRWNSVVTKEIKGDVSRKRSGCHPSKSNFPWHTIFHKWNLFFKL